MFKNGWQFNDSEGKKAILKTNIEGKNIFLLFKKSVKNNAGKREQNYRYLF